MRYLTGILLASCATSAWAQTAPAVTQSADAEYTNTNDIVVSARKRAETVQDVPVAVTALDAAALSRMNATSLAEVRSAPNVSLTHGSLQPTALVVFIRGVGIKAQEPFVDLPIAVSVDGVYLPIASGSLVDLFDVEQLEILRGPQGTLQGRNSPGGAVNITTRRPRFDTGFQGELGYARFNTFTAKAGVDLPLIDDTLAMRISGVATNGDGQNFNLFTNKRIGGRKVYSGRVSFLFKPTPELDIFLSGDFTANRSDQPGVRAINDPKVYPTMPTVVCAAFQICSNLKPNTVSQDNDRPYFANYGGVSLTANYDFGGATLTSVTGYRKFRDSQSTDLDALGLDLISLIDRVMNYDVFSEEVRLSSNSRGRPVGGQFDWLVGGIIYNFDFDLTQPINVFGQLLPPTYIDQQVRSQALFAQASYHITDQWSVSGGVRQTWDKKTLHSLPTGFPASARVTANNKWDNLSFEAGTEFRATPQHLLYARFAQGYRSGGVNGTANDPRDVLPFEPETIDSYEIGAKTEWLDRALVVNLSLFRNKYKNLLREIVVKSNAGVGFATLFKNAAAATIKGFELETIINPSPNLTVRASYGYLDAKYDSFFADLIGNGVITDNRHLRQPFAPKHSLSASAEYRIPMGENELTFMVAANMKSDFTVNPSDFAIAAQDGYVTGDASVRYSMQGGKLAFEVFATNFGDTRYIVAAEAPSNVANWAGDGDRASYGARLMFKF